MCVALRAAGGVRRRGMDLTLHRCFDLVPDMGAALEEAVALGFRRILTSGGEATAEAGAARIAALIAQAAGRIGDHAGVGGDARKCGDFMGLGTGELHGSCSVGVAVDGPGVSWALARRSSGGRMRQRCGP